MKYLTFGDTESNSYSLCILVNNLNKDKIIKEYLTPFGIDPEMVIAIETHHTGAKGKKTTAKDKKAWIQEELGPTLQDLNVQYLVITDGEYFKTITGKPKIEPYYGYILPSEYGSFNCIYASPLEAIFYDPMKIRARIVKAMTAVKDHVQGIYTDPGINIIDNAYYLYEIDGIRDWLENLLKQDIPLTCDIEGFSLKHYSAGIGTIAFAWNEREGIAIPIDILDNPEHTLQVKDLLRSFFERFTNKMIYHNISYDVTVLIYELFMDHLIDTEGLLYGLEIMLRNWDDTKLITYLATNSCAGNKLGLKDQAQEYAGNYAVEEIKDIRKIPLPELLQYNLVDCLSTWYVRNKHYNTMVADNQLEIYQTIFKPAIIDIIQMQLTGLPVNMERVSIVKTEMELDYANSMALMQSNPVVQQFSYLIVEDYVNKKNEKWVKKRTTVNEILIQAQSNDTIKEEITFNPNSGIQLAKLLHEQLGLPVIETTKTGQPATDAKTLKALKNHTQDSDILAFLTALADYASVTTILTTFIPALEQAQLGPDGWYYLFGNFNLGGTLSGRLSSSKPNLQNLPASSKYAKRIKWCIQAPPGWFWCGLDFASLEDRISALTTKDPNKLKVYTDGWDGHAMRAVVYFKNQMPDIDPTNMQQVNALSKPDHKYKPLRDKSKNPTFALTYQGTYATLMRNYNFPEALAKQCEAAYQDLYKISVKWVNDKLDQAMIDGYVDVAFGLRVRTPLLAQVIRGNKKTPAAAEAEGRSVGNAMGQSWCLLNSRAGSEFMGKVRKSEHRLNIRICAQIHDANYFLVRDDIDAIMFANEHMVKAAEWQEHPDIQHPDVGLGGELSIFYPDWSKELSLPNHASEEVIYQKLQEHLDKLNKPKEN